MKKTIVLLMVAAFSMTVMTGCKKEDTAASANVEEMTQLVMGFDASFPPYGYQDADGEYVGFDIDLAQEVCNRLDIELVKQPIDWDAKDMELGSGAIDCIWNGFTMSDERLDSYTWSTPYVDNSQVMVVAADSGISTIEDLAGKVVAVQAGSSALEALTGEDTIAITDTFAELLEVPEYNSAFMNLDAGAVDAVALDIGVAKFQMESRGNGYVMLEKPIATEVYAIGFALGETALRNMIQEQLDEMAEDGTFMEIATEWGLADSVTLGK